MTKYIGSQPATSFEAVKKDRFTGLTGTGVTLSHSVSSVQDIVVWVNNVKQDYNNYTVSGTALTLGGSLVSADVVQVLYVGRTFQTANPSAASVGNNEVASTIITGQTAETSIATDDLILLSDTSASGALKKMTRANFVSGIGGTNTPAFHARGSGTQTASIGSSTKLTFGTEEVDTDSAFASDRFTVPSGKAGKYYIYSAARHNTQNGSGASDVSLRIFKNGSLYNNHAMGYYDNTAQIDFSSVSAVMDLAVSDYIEIYIYIDTGSNNAVYDDRMFLGYKLIT